MGVRHTRQSNPNFLQISVNDFRFNVAIGETEAASDLDPKEFVPRPKVVQYTRNICQALSPEFVNVGEVTLEDNGLAALQTVIRVQLSLCLISAGTVFHDVSSL
jgi:hypothetical protein